jgi:hypothetical protein
MSESNIEPIKKLKTIHITGVQRVVLLELCDGMAPENKAKARLYGRVFQWATAGEWEAYDDWFVPDQKVPSIPTKLLRQTYQLDATKKQTKAITVIIEDALEKGILPGKTLRKLDRIYRQIEGESMVIED